MNKNKLNKKLYYKLLNKYFKYPNIIRIFKKYLISIEYLIKKLGFMNNTDKM